MHWTCSKGQRQAQGVSGEGEGLYPHAEFLLACTEPGGFGI